MADSWQLFIDTGGTFTDAIAISPQGSLRRAKILSSSALRGTIDKVLKAGVYRIASTWSAPTDLLSGGKFRLLDHPDSQVAIRRFNSVTNHIELAALLPFEPPDGSHFEIQFDEEAPVLAARLLTGTPAGGQLPPLDMRLGTTLATNALLTRTGARLVQFITRGFADLLTIGTQQRPELFELHIEKPEVLPAAVVEVDARLAADGKVLKKLELIRLDSQIRALLADGFNSAAVTLLHADRYPEQEQALANHLRQAGFAQVSCSGDMAQEVRILPRAGTAVVDAYLAPVVNSYLHRIRSSLAHSHLLVMTSAGGLMGPATSRPKDMLLSGPAGGVVGAASAARQTGMVIDPERPSRSQTSNSSANDFLADGISRTEGILSFDMGGTSTDVARYDGAYDYVFEHRVGDAHLFAPALAIETVAAGGGSLCQKLHGSLAVGPDSAGADPGPACYGAGGPLTLTDVNLLLGLLDPGQFGIPISWEQAYLALKKIYGQLSTQPTRRKAKLSPMDLDLLDGFRQIANERMADAMRRISIRRGYDPAAYSLVTFGGAGGQHACAVAELLGILHVLVPADAGLLSAWGMASAMVERFATRQLLAPLTDIAPALPTILKELANEASQAVSSEGARALDISIQRRIAEMRFAGQESTLQVELSTDSRLSADFLYKSFIRHFKSIYGHQPDDRPVELVSLRVVAAAAPPARSGNTCNQSNIDPISAEHTRAPVSVGHHRAWVDGCWQDVPVFQREKLTHGDSFRGPALIFDPHSATVVAPGWQVMLRENGAFTMNRVDEVPSASGRQNGRRGGTKSPPEAVQVELFSARFAAIAREMGAALERTAVSTNVKERLDFSCAVLDAMGELIVNAPHIPVHLGSLGMCVRAVRNVLPLKPGDMAVTNHPAFGGSHLPDLTVLAPVYLARELIGYVAARAHHAEIGGVQPGSMPPAARRLVEEGVVIPPTLLVRDGQADFATVTDFLLGGPYPTRALADNLSDLRAAVAACHQGVRSLIVLAREHGHETVAHYMTALKERAANRLREALVRLGDGNYKAEQQLDDGTRLVVRIVISNGEAVIDFNGSAAVHAGNLNATPAIVHSVVVYVLRLLVQEDIPLNEGLLSHVRIIIPAGILSPPFGVQATDFEAAPSIVGGNVETSQRLVDLLLLALKTCAASQGTMNNVLFGNDDFSYYETVGGGSGAGPGWSGASGVHCHMTNTRITDPELLELRYPVRLERFALRKGSGGRGRHYGGDGLVRDFSFLTSLELSLLSQRRQSGPYGMMGGAPGKPGTQKLVKRSGHEIALDGIAACKVEAGDRLELQTPGGGGYGRADSENQDECNGSAATITPGDKKGEA